MVSRIPMKFDSTRAIQDGTVEVDASSRGCVAVSLTISESNECLGFQLSREDAIRLAREILTAALDT